MLRARLAWMQTERGQVVVTFDRLIAALLESGVVPHRVAHPEPVGLRDDFAYADPGPADIERLHAALRQQPTPAQRLAAYREWRAALAAPSEVKETKP